MTGKLYGYKILAGVLLYSVLMNIGLVSVHAANTPTLNKKLTALISANSNNASIGIAVEQLSGPNSAMLYAHNQAIPFLPASTMKLFTSSVALENLGPEFSVDTSVYATGPIDSTGTINGDLILYGRGDPDLTSANISTLAMKLVALGIKHITGSIIGDSSYFDGPAYGPGWDATPSERTAYYSAEISALTVNENAVQILVTPGSEVGSTAIAMTADNLPIIQFQNSVLTTSRGTRSKIVVTRGASDNTVTLSGTIAKGSKPLSYVVAVHDPALLAAAYLSQSLSTYTITADKGIRSVDASAQAVNPFDTKSIQPLASIQSQTLASDLIIMNKQSDNLHAELWLRQVGRQLRDSGIYNTPTDSAFTKIAMINNQSVDQIGIAQIRDFAHNNGISENDLTIYDGSGLSSEDQVAPEATAAILSAVSSKPYFSVLLQSLPDAGIDGTLKNRLQSFSKGTVIIAKTGTLNSTNALAGYVIKMNNMIAFSIVVDRKVSLRPPTALVDSIAKIIGKYGF